MWFELVSEPTDIETIAVSQSIRELRRLQKVHGQGRWRKLKGFAHIRLGDDEVVLAELHWYEAHGIGRREMKVKAILDG
jgi:hypothetical protein